MKMFKLFEEVTDKMKKSKLLVAALALLVAVGALAGCGGKKEEAKSTVQLEGTLTAAGSTALLPLLKPAAEEFMKKHPKVTVNISGGGSVTGQNQVASGNVNIGNSDVPVVADLKDKGLVEYDAAIAPFVLITHPSNVVKGITQEQAIDIFTGKITNWKELGGKDEKITIIHRSKSSGSRLTIKEKVLKGTEFTDNAIIQDSNGAVRAAIAGTPGAIGYVDAPYLDNTIKGLAYNGVEYSAQAVKDGKWPVYAATKMMTKGEATGLAKAFIDFVRSPEFQNSYAEKAGFIPVTSLKKQ
jgi:phosphate transport system substrate-binding protein